MARIVALSLVMSAAAELSAQGQDLSTRVQEQNLPTQAQEQDTSAESVRTEPRHTAINPRAAFLPSPFKPLSLGYIAGFDHFGNFDNIGALGNVGGFDHLGGLNAIGRLDYPAIHSPSGHTAPYQPHLLAPKIVPYRLLPAMNRGTSAPNELRERRPWDSGGDLSLYARDGYALTLSGRHSSYPSMGFSSTLTLGQTWEVVDGITVQGGVYTSDNLYHTTRFKDFGVAGSLGVEVMDGVKLVGFGAHSIYNSAGGNGAVPPRMYTGDYYGGGVRFRVAGKLGLEAGARRDYNPFTRQWDTTPYVMPVIY